MCVSLDVYIFSFVAFSRCCDQIICYKGDENETIWREGRERHSFVSIFCSPLLLNSKMEREQKKGDQYNTHDQKLPSTNCNNHVTDCNKINIIHLRFFMTSKLWKKFCDWKLGHKLWTIAEIGPVWRKSFLLNWIDLTVYITVEYRLYIKSYCGKQISNY